ncbi:SNF2 family N-terminal domain-containing protein [Cunninghamella echinulata]|nr:SNF2 family N-terminal domain-containing protein [Cunninghamella echinulata]
MNNHDQNEGKLISKENNMEIRINNDQESKINPSPSEQEVKNDQVNVEQKVHIKEDNENELTAESESSILNKNKRNGKKTRRHIMIEEKLKGLTKRSLFDTDGDISSHNILEPENGALRATRQSRKRKASDDDLHSKIHQPSSSSLSQSSRNQQTLFKKGKSNNNNNITVRKISMIPSTSNQRKSKNKVGNDHDISNTSSSSSSLMGPSLQKQNKRLPTAAENAAALMQQRKESVNLLRPAPKTSVDRLRNEKIRDRELELQRILAHHDTMIRELAHLEVYQTILDYQPTFLNNDERVKKFILEYNLWDLANEYLLNKQRSSPGIRTRHIQGQKLPLIKMLQHSTELDALTGFTETKSNIPNDTQRQILLQSLPPAAVNTIKSGTGIRRINRQFPTLDDYLASFTYLDDTDDATNEDIKEYIEREQSIRDRIRELEGNGGFTITTSKLKEIANKRPQLESIPTAESAAADDNGEEKDELSTHDLIISQAIASSKLFRGHTKYRKNAARKCAKAIEKYWENIRTREERLQRQESKRIIRLAKWTAQQVKSKWRVVERICEARYKEIVKEQQAKKSRRHLEMILEHSEQMLGVRKDELAQHHSTISENDDNDDSISEGVCNTGSAVEDDNNNFGMDPPPLLTEDDTNASELEQLNSFDEWSESMIDKDDNSTSSGQGSVLGLEDEDERDHFIDESDDVEDSEDDVEDLKQDQNLTVEELYEKYKALYNKNNITGDQRDNENEKEQEVQEEQEEQEEEKEKTNDTSSSNNKVDDNSVENDNVLNSNTSDEYEEVESANHNTQLAVLTTEIFDNEDNHGNSDDDDGVADSEYSESDEENRDDFIISDNSESEDDNEALLSLEANAQLSIDDLRAQYESMVKKIEHDTTSTVQTTADVLENGNNTSEQNATSFILEPISLENVDDKSNMNKIGKHSIELSDNEQITTSSFSISKKRKLDTLSDKTIQHNVISEIDDTTVLGENTNYNLEDSIDNNENDDDDDRTVTDYGSEPPDDDDNNDSDVNHKNTLIINETPEIPKENDINNSNDNDINNDHDDDKLIDDTSNQHMELQHSENESVSKNKHIPVSNPEVNNDYESINMTDTENDNNDIESTDKTYESSAYETESEKQQQQQATVLPTGTTLSTTNVSTRVPFLLRGTLREYQHVGLDWLVSLYNNGLNGILADEMGLGKTIQTIALLASLACEKGIWGPHLVVVPTSVLLNWEMEFKRWLPGFKILTYYGNPKERKEKRVGWSKENAFHVCITSYQLVIQDQSAFKRKPWQYLILDEAHHIKNFRSQRWQVLLNFNSKRRLLLTGTPLQNNLMELWSLLYFLMPNGISSAMPIGFANLREFQEWFSNPVDLMIEGEEGMTEESRNAIQKLHTVLRPYLLRRLKLDVERQMPAKYEHVMYCKLSKRQRYLYDDFMGRAKTKETLASGNFLSIINALMQLRKVCNHPDLFEERPIVTSFCMTNTIQEQGKMLEKWVLCRWNIYSNDIDKINLETSHDLVFVQPALEMTTSQLVANDYTSLDCSKQIIKTIQKIQTQVATNGIHSRSIQSGKKYVDLKTHHQAYLLQQQLATAQRWQSILNRNQQRCEKRPLYGIGLIEKCQQLFAKPYHIKFFPTPENNYHLDAVTYPNRSDIIRDCVLSYENRIQRYMDIIKYYTFVTPAAIVQSVPILTPTSFIPLNYNKNFNINNNTNNSNVYYHNHQQQQQPLSLTLSSSTSSAYINNSNNINYIKDIFHPISSRLKIAFPDKRLLQYDCGKLQRLATLLQDLSAGEHRALIFTQMTKVLDILESFLNMHGYRYLRLDGATKVEQRQVLTERFNNDKRITCFILSTRSGGLGINLTGADTVIFYDSDWNPSMDKQCQDRAHRIGQVRDVHIYRFVTEYTIEETIFKKANQKRLLDDMVIQEGGFTNDYFQKMDWWRDLPEIAGNIGSRRSENKEESIIEETQESNNIDMERALLEAEGDEIDAQAAIAARNEMIMDDHDFDDSIQSTPKLSSSTQYNNNSSLSSSIANSPKNISASSNRSTPQLPPSSPPSASLSPSFPHQASSPTLSSYETTIVTPTPTLNKNDDANELSIMSHINNNNDDEYNNNEFDEHMEVGHVDQYMLRFWEREIFGDYLGFGGLPKPVDFE